MIFRSKMDAPFIGSISAAILLIAAATIVPLFLEDVQFSEMLILMAIFFVTTGFILWTIFDIQYIFHKDHLFVKGGPFRSRIPYNDILKVSPTRNIFTGYRLLSARDALELTNNKTMFSTIKISPTDQDAFIAELKERCPELLIDEKLQ
ncbi:PH domain-containing protein [Planococcus dechangensis]|uniref:PH domain-containing protein n=1 Tax=Planococcus dechangensis TaxID=1176255 RepID=A0ABV9MAK0_9BACL